MNSMTLNIPPGSSYSRLDTENGPVRTQMLEFEMIILGLGLLCARP